MYLSSLTFLGIIAYDDRVEAYFRSCNYGKKQGLKNSPTSLPGKGLLPRATLPHYHWFKTPLGPLFPWEKTRHMHHKFPVYALSMRCCCLVAQSLQRRGLQHAGLPCLSQSPGVWHCVACHGEDVTLYSNHLFCSIVFQLPWTCFRYSQETLCGCSFLLW